MNVAIDSMTCPKANVLNTDHLEMCVRTAVEKSWASVAPCWPLQHFIAANPLAGFEHLSFDQALQQGQAYFCQKDLPTAMHAVNRESIKWLKAFFDVGQSTLAMPLRHQGLLPCMMQLMCYDKYLNRHKDQIEFWLQKDHKNPESLIVCMLLYLGVAETEQKAFLTLMLATLPGWSAYVKYQTDWADKQISVVTPSEYFAFRLLITCLLWPEAKQLLDWHQQALKNNEATKTLTQLKDNERAHQKKLLEKLAMAESTTKPDLLPEVQMVFCIDVRSEPFRRAIESQGNYETFGFAGFFGVSIAISNTILGKSHASCPVLLKPSHQVTDKPNGVRDNFTKDQQRSKSLKLIYQSLNYTFSTPFSLAEIMGVAYGAWMGLKSLMPRMFAYTKARICAHRYQHHELVTDCADIPLEQQIELASNALKLMGLTERFSPLVVLCAHASSTQNNAFASALDCGACGGNPGAPNARVLTTILNHKEVRNALNRQDICIPDSTLFVAAEHNTTTDAVDIFSQSIPETWQSVLSSLEQNLLKAKERNARWRMSQIKTNVITNNPIQHTILRSEDWAQVRPEWGLARNASMIIGPRSLTKGSNLEGRSFLHSYDWSTDFEGKHLHTIMTAPMIVAQWINAQYLFSTLDNVAFGSGSKITHNVVGKLGVMQGNASDLMHGLPLQSVFQDDKSPFHQPVRLTVVIYAPKERIVTIIEQEALLNQLISNAWIHIICFDSSTHQPWQLNRGFIWQKID